jgi:serine/threonine-protein kinase
MTSVPPSPPPPGSRPGGTNPAAAAASTPTGFIGRYQVLEKIGEGGMGSLYLARDPAIDRLVAIKLLRRGFDTESLRERFAREARAAGRLRHPNIVTIFDVGEHDGDPFIAMEFLAGETLGELIRHGAGLSLSRRLKLLEELCDGLAYAHRAGLVHRDVKPANLMVDAEGVLKILDFGIVRVGESGMTQAGVLVGTINYMAPEQVLGTGVDHRSDIFAVGLVAYELLSGKQAFAGTMKDGLLKRIPNAEIQPLSELVPGLDPDVVLIVDHALKKEPGDRYQELARMRNDLTRARQRIEIAEEQAAIEAASASAETALISQEPTMAGEPEPVGVPSFGLIDQAERALQQGQYRIALTIAGRAAALNPLDAQPSTIVARAEAGLLDRGRSVGLPLPTTPPAPLSVPVSSTPPSTPSPVSTASGTGSQRASYLAVAVAVMALVVAAFAVWARFGDGRSVSPAESTAVNSGTATPAQNPVPPAATVPPPPPQTQAPAPAAAASQAQSDAAQAPSNQRGAPPSAPEDSARRTDRTSGRGETPRPAPTSRPERQTSAADQKTPPKTEPARENRPPAMEPPPSPPVTPALPSASGTVSLPSAPRPSTPPAPKPVEATPKTPESKPPDPKPEPPARDPKAEAMNEIRGVLRRYEAAWKALNYEALAAVQQLSRREGETVRGFMKNTREYHIEMSAPEIELAPDGRRATARASVTRRHPRPIGSGDNVTTQATTFQLERSGERWVIVGIK